MSESVKELAKIVTELAVALEALGAGLAKQPGMADVCAKVTKKARQAKRDAARISGNLVA